jgi:cytoskeletal protein RodZ
MLGGRDGGSHVQRSTLGVGTALRKVREGRGLTLEEAARDTRVRREFLDALEAEEFDRLLGEVHVRGCLRTYATYLGLSPDKVVTAYEQDHAPEPTISTATPPPGRVEPVLGRRRRRDDHRLLILFAATVLVFAGAFGVLSARRPAPAPADLPAEPTIVEAEAGVDRQITVAVEARRPVDVTIVADGGDPQRYSLAADEGRSFEADTSITVRLSEGASARVTVSGVDYGFPGKPDSPWQETFSFGDARSTAG